MRAVLVLTLLLVAPALAQEHDHGQRGRGHDKWHEKFYQGLLDGEWVVAPQEVIQRLGAPDGGAHVCAPTQVGTNKGKLYCVVLPPET
jgi:hypothetical protein